MSRRTLKRFGLYGATALALALLVYFGFVREVDAEVGTLVNAAEAQAKLGMLDEAIDYLDRAIVQDSEYRWAWLLKADCHGKKGEWDESVAAFDKALELTGPAEEDRPALRLHHAHALVCAGRPEDAVTEAREVLEEYPDQHQGWIVISNARLAQGKSEEAVQALQELERARPDDIVALVLQAEVAEKEGRLQDALALLDRSEKIDPESDLVLRRQARLLAKAGEKEAAIEKLEAAAKLSLVRTRNSLRGEEPLEILLEDPRVQAILTVTPDSDRSSDDENK